MPKSRCGLGLFCVGVAVVSLQGGCGSSIHEENIGEGNEETASDELFVIPPTPSKLVGVDECSITLSEDGKTTTYSKLMKTSGEVTLGKWASIPKSTFIVGTNGPCAFQVFSEENFKGSRVTIGTSLNTTIRAGLDGIAFKDAGNKNTWPVRSIIIAKSDTTCQLRMGGSSGAMMTYFVGGYPYVPRTTTSGGLLGGDCRAKVWHYTNLGEGDYDNRFKAFHPSGKLSQAFPVGFEVSSFLIQNDGATCDPDALDKGRCLPEYKLGTSLYNLAPVQFEGPSDADEDGLNDKLENELADAFRPIYLNHSTEDGTRVNVYQTIDGDSVMEPVTIFQVHPDGDNIVRLQFMKLWRYDVYDTFSCGGHPGDSQHNVYHLKTKPKGDPLHGKYWWLFKSDYDGAEDYGWHQGNGGLRGLHFEKWSGESGPARHPVIYFSKGKHHEYYDAGWSGETDNICGNITAYVNGRGHLHNPPYPKRLAILKQPAGQSPFTPNKKYNNVGSKAHHEGFINDLAPYGFAGECVWNCGKFYSDDASSPSKGFM